MLKLRSENVAWHEIENGEIVCLDITSSRYLSFNASGAVLWKLVAAGTTRADLVLGLREAFAIDESVAARDVDAFLAELRQRGLLHD